MKKGLRHSVVRDSLFGGVFESRPYEEGIKTDRHFEEFENQWSLNRDLMKKGLRP